MRAAQTAKVPVVWADNEQKVFEPTMGAKLLTQCDAEWLRYLARTASVSSEVVVCRSSFRNCCTSKEPGPEMCGPAYPGTWVNRGLLLQ